MPNVSQLEGVDVAGPGDKPLGRVTHVLFHPEEPRAVGYEIEPARWLGVLRRKPRYVPWESLTVGHGVLWWGESRLPSARASAKAADFLWELTVIWRGMPVRTEDGVSRGAVRDVRVSKTTGKVLSLLLTGGVAADVALGRAEVPGEMVVGFDGSSVVVEDRAAEVETAGGLAATAGKGAAAAKVVATDAARKAGELGMKAAIGIGRTVKKSRFGDALRGLRDAAAEGYRDGGEDERG